MPGLRYAQLGAFISGDRLKVKNCLRRRCRLTSSEAKTDITVRMIALTQLWVSQVATIPDCNAAALISASIAKRNI
jgi:hypothetical protein